MTFISHNRYIRMAPRKIRPLASRVRRMKKVSLLLPRLEALTTRGAYYILKTLKSAVGNARNKNSNLTEDKLMLKEIRVEQGPVLKRFRPRARGRANMYLRRSSSITIVLEEG